MSVLQPIRKRKSKTKLLTHEGVRVVNREDYEGFEIDTKVELIRSLIPIDIYHSYNTQGPLSKRIEEVLAMA